MAGALTKMRALVAEAGEVRLAEVPRPRLKHDTDVLILVIAAGICRTDAYVAQGLIATPRAVILGHELAGVVVATGAAVRGFDLGSHVTADPVCGCGTCAGCQGAAGCYRPTTMGIDHHGCFAEYVAVPAALLHLIPEGMTPFEAAYVEPVAACLAIFAAGISPKARGAVAGDNRFARLTRALLAHRDYNCAPVATELPPCSLDYAVETGLDPNTLQMLVRALRPGGTLVLKSRTPANLPLSARDLVVKNLRVHAVSYGSFAEAISLLAEGKVLLDAEHIEEVDLDNYREVLGPRATDAKDEFGKAFFVLSGAGRWPSCAAS